MKLPEAYQPQKYEADIYGLWEQNGVFKPENRGNDDRFSMVAPPPNANANLHIGYGLTIAIEDSIVRYQRMKGKATLFIPGADHAGFETWVVYEKKLNEEGKSRFDYSREELYRQVWDFVELNKHNFQSQIRALGASCDWTRFTYTLDSKVVAQAYETFHKMWEDKLIYRGKRIVNYCTFHGTSFSDIEVVHEEEEGQLWYIAYPLADGNEEVVIATTRPETKLGQSALMVNPEDKRYKHLIGKLVRQPLVPDKPIKIIADDYVDMEFGTGVVTVTPAHDPNDFAVAERHNLPAIELITPEGKMSDNVPEQFRGLSVLEAREAVAEELARRGFLRGMESYIHSVAKCYKCGSVIEPLLKEQWFVRMEPLAKKALEVLKDKKISFYPDSKRRQLIRYLEGLKDWNISRQIAWGIPIPAFQNIGRPEEWIFNTQVDQEVIEIDGQKYRRDPDVFDTWFSSSAWPYVTLGYPDSEDFKKYYPLNLMETAGEILYPWVSRMIMMGLYTTGEVPFKEVYIHGLVLAKGGAKMSKSLGNVVDAMEIVASYGSDALRMGLLAGRAPGVNRGYDPRRVEEARNFCNKLWNVARFIESKVDKGQIQAAPGPQVSADHWILNKLSIAANEMPKLLENYRLSEAYELLYQFTWRDLADWYIEAAKVAGNQAMMAYVLETSLKLAHPFAPFLTEAIWQTLAWQENTILAVQNWPDAPEFDASQAKDFEGLKLGVEEIRRIIAATGVSKPKLFSMDSPLIEANSALISRLAGLGGIEKVSQAPKGLRLSSAGSAWLDIDPTKYLDKLKEAQKAREEAVKVLENRLSSGDYVAKAPQELVDQTKKQLEQEESELAKIKRELESFSKN